MNKQKSRAIALLMAVIMALTAIPFLTVSAGAAKAKLDPTGKVLTISGSGKLADYSSNMQAPYYNNKEIEKVVITDGITHIGNYYFCNMQNLKTVEFPDSLKSIGKSAFYSCQLLSDASVESVELIDDYAFYYCFGLESVSFGNSLKKIGNYAFAQCVRLNNFVIPEPCEEIGSFAFAWCYGLTEIELPATLKKLGDSVFNGCINLTDIYYSGTEEQFNRINKGSGNDDILRLVRFSNSLPITPEPEPEPEPKEKMQIGRDNNSFPHSSTSFFNDNELVDSTETPGKRVGKYYIEDNYFQKLCEYYNQDVSNSFNPNSSNTLIFERESEWGGSCFGITATMKLAFLKKILLSNFVPGKTVYYTPEVLPKDSSDFRSLINYYHLSQYLPRIYEKKHTAYTENSDFEDMLKEIVSLAKESEATSEPFVFAFGWTYSRKENNQWKTKKAGHAIDCVGCSEETDYYRIQFIDPNNTDDYIYADVSKDYSKIVFETKYGDLDTKPEYSYKDFTLTRVGYYERHVFDSIDIDGSSSGCGFESQSITDSEQDSSNDMDIIIFDANSAFTIKSSNGESLSYSAGKFSGDMVILDEKTFDKGDSEDYQITVKSSASYTVTSLSEQLEISINNADSYYAYSGSGVKELEVNMSDSLKATGTDMNCNMYIGVNDEDTNLIRVSNEKTDELYVEYDGDKVTTEGSNLDKCEVTGYDNEKSFDIPVQKTGDKIVVDLSDEDPGTPASPSTPVAPEKPDKPIVIPDISIKNYTPSLSVSYKSRLVFHTNIEAPEGYEIVWSDGQKGSSCSIEAKKDEYRISASLIKDGKTVKTTQEEVVTVKTGFFAKLMAFFRSLIGKPVVYIDNIKQ